VVFFALAGNGGQAWGTHYDAVFPAFAQVSLAKKLLYEALVPQMMMWIGWTVVVGSAFGTVAAAFMRLWKPLAQAVAN